MIRIELFLIYKAKKPQVSSPGLCPSPGASGHVMLLELSEVKIKKMLCKKTT